MSPQKSAFWKIGVYFSMEKSVERGRFVFWRTIIRPPFRSEWRDRGLRGGGGGITGQVVPGVEAVPVRGVCVCVCV